MKKQIKFLKSYFLFSREHRSGIFLLAILIVLLQFIYYGLKSGFFSFKADSKENQEWLLVQSKIDSLKKVKTETSYQIQPFNPNFISDYKGYMLGMSIDEIDRLHQFRAKNKYVNSANEFQAVTQVSNELLQKIAPFFKFPDWVTNAKKQTVFETFSNKKKEKINPINLNDASKEDLMKIYGIGDKISDIILKERDKFGAFASVDQLEYVWGISPEILESCKQHFFVPSDVVIKKIHINNASVKELSQFPYFNYAFSKQIVTYRSMNGVFHSIEDLAKINNCPLEKLKIIALYLEF
ncbi:helix-hairpin-helix domain-containing protein [Flavobacterium sp. NRK F7]|uniref:ComEA family DNA-binding protein n=1 Tax=Flavobacterium sp. NRK F7 TaxID=2954930 RepID=UPI0020912A83|nr:helix-hairpin-helix domain-containing protein [Flavobacterium sp. NRK F7]MCO6162468.1 helix-hairpin-helix domain-containing protein [Flavobacterium sp. NRK F7]